MDNALEQPLQGPWSLPSRVVGAHRLALGEAPGIPPSALAVARSLPALMAERAVLASAWTGTEALGGPQDSMTTVVAEVPRLWVVLTHGGPRCADVQRDRPMAAAEVRDPLTGRTPAALDEPGWDVVHRAFVEEARRVLDQGAWAIGVEAARGHLWHAAISPLLTGDVELARRGMDRLCRLTSSLAKLGPRVSVSLAVEDVAAMGLHAAQTARLATSLVDAGATLVVARTGCPFLPSRFPPPEPRRPEEEGLALHAARWLVQALGPRCPVACAGGLRSRAVAQRAVAGSCCHLVVVGKPLREGRVLISPSVNHLDCA